MELTNELLSELKQIVNDLGGKIRSYSGRSMYGKECLGIDTDASLFTLVFYIARNEALADFFESHISSTRTDSMGLGQIIYWPNLAAPSPDFEEDECEECEYPQSECVCE